MALNDEQIDELTHIFSAVGEARAKLPSRSREFFDQMLAAFEEHGAEMRLSPKQRQWLVNLMEEFG